MKHARWVCCLAVAVMASSAGAEYQLVIDFEDYALGNLDTQDGWSVIVGTDLAGAQVVNTDNGPSLPGVQAVDLTNWQSEIRLEKPIADVVAAGGPLVTFQYDVKDVFNLDDPLWSTSLFRTRLYGDDGEGGSFAPVGNMHFDGGAGPANQAWVSSTPDGQTGGWSPIGDPAWTDTDWHTVSWTFNYATGVFSGVTFDGTEYPHPDEYFVDWNAADPGGIATAGDMLRMWLMGYDNNDYWKIDNYIITATPEPASLALLALGGLVMLRRRR